MFFLLETRQLRGFSAEEKGEGGPSLTPDNLFPHSPSECIPEVFAACGKPQQPSGILRSADGDATEQIGVNSDRQRKSSSAREQPAESADVKAKRRRLMARLVLSLWPTVADLIAVLFFGLRRCFAPLCCSRCIKEKI